MGVIQTGQEGRRPLRASGTNTVSSPSKRVFSILLYRNVYMILKAFNTRSAKPKGSLQLMSSFEEAESTRRAQPSSLRRAVQLGGQKGGCRQPVPTRASSPAAASWAEPSAKGGGGVGGGRRGEPCVLFPREARMLMYAVNPHLISGRNNGGKKGKV